MTTNSNSNSKSNAPADRSDYVHDLATKARRDLIATDKKKGSGTSMAIVALVDALRYDIDGALTAAIKGLFQDPQSDAAKANATEWKSRVLHALFGFGTLDRKQRKDGTYHSVLDFDSNARGEDEKQQATAVWQRVNASIPLVYALWQYGCSKGWEGDWYGLDNQNFLFVRAKVIMTADAFSADLSKVDKEHALSTPLKLGKPGWKPEKVKGKNNETSILPDSFEKATKLARKLHPSLKRGGNGNASKGAKGPTVKGTPLEMAEIVLSKADPKDRKLAASDEKHARTILAHLLRYFAISDAKGNIDTDKLAATNKQAANG